MRLRPVALSLIHGWDAGGELGGTAETWSLQILTSDGTGQGDRSEVTWGHPQALLSCHV